MTEFEQIVAGNIAKVGNDKDLQALSRLWVRETIPYQYAYNFRWMGRPIIQIPQDIVAVQELMWHIKPDLVIETGIAHGGSLILSASMLALIDMAEAIEEKRTFDPSVSQRKVLGLDIDIRAHNRAAIEAHPMASRIQMIQGSSIDPAVVAEVHRIAAGHQRVMVFLDSNHTHDHVLEELRAYAPLVSVGSYCVVFDSGVEDLPEHYCQDRPWGKGNNPKTALWEYLQENDAFEIDKNMDYKLLLSAVSEGWLKRVR